MHTVNLPLVVSLLSVKPLRQFKQLVYFLIGLPAFSSYLSQYSPLTSWSLSLPASSALHGHTALAKPMLSCLNAGSFDEVLSLLLSPPSLMSAASCSKAVHQSETQSPSPARWLFTFTRLTSCSLTRFFRFADSIVSLSSFSIPSAPTRLRHLTSELGSKGNSC